MFNSKDYKGVAITESFQNALNDERYASKQVGSNPSIKEGMKVTGTKLDFFPNIQVYGDEEYDNLKPFQQSRCVKQDDGTYKSDNSFFGMQTTGDLGRISFSSLVGYNQYKKRLTKEQKTDLANTLKKFKKEEKDIISIVPGGVDYVAQQVGKLLGKELTVVKQFVWEEGSQPEGATKPLQFKQRMDVYIQTPAPASK